MSLSMCQVTGPHRLDLQLPWAWGLPVGPDSQGTAPVHSGPGFQPPSSHDCLRYVKALWARLSDRGPDPAMRGLTPTQTLAPMLISSVTFSKDGS